MKEQVILYFDIGNTNTKIGYSRGNSPVVSYALPTKERQTYDQIGLSLLGILGHQGATVADVSVCVGCSVVPEASRLYHQACDKYLRQTLLLAPEDLSVPLQNHYARPHEVGADRLVGAYAARKLFPQHESIISVDFGTATTFDCVSAEAYLGGLICPGVQSSINALASNTAKLPRVDFSVTEAWPVAGTSTAMSLSHGFVFGFAAMAEGLCKRLADQLPGKTLVIATGGFAAEISRVTACFDKIMPDLLLEGLRFLYNHHNGIGIKTPFNPKELS